MTHMAQMSPVANSATGVGAPVNPAAVGAGVAGAAIPVGTHSPTSYQYTNELYMSSSYPNGVPTPASATTTGVPTYPQPPSISAGYPSTNATATYTQLPSPVSPSSEHDSPMNAKSSIPNIVFTG